MSALCLSPNKTPIFRGYPLLKFVALAAIALLTIPLLCGSTARDVLAFQDRIYPIAPTTNLVAFSTNPAASLDRPCRQIPGAEDILVVIKTGATELEAKLPVHLRTSTLCYSDYVIFSDFEEDVEGHHIYDALDQVNDDIKSRHNDFELYRRLQVQGRKALNSSELNDAPGTGPATNGKTDNAGWRLDKWKFLPMMNKTLTMYPDKEWYVFVETDTYLVWSNLLQWIAMMDPEKPIYAGYQMQIGEQVFAHGGSGFVVSNYAMRLVTDHYARNTSWWDTFTSGQWAGDCVLGKAFEDAGSPLLWSWPLTQGERPNTLDFWKKDYAKRLWCFPALTYHHMSSDEIETMWTFEREWIQNVSSEYNIWHLHVVTPSQQQTVLRQKDVFTTHILPQLLSGERGDWDNLSGDLHEETEVDTLSECRDMCQDWSECKQYRLAARRCMISDEIKLGGPVSTELGVQSGWMRDRINQAVHDVEHCGTENWIL